MGVWWYSWKVIKWDIFGSVEQKNVKIGVRWLLLLVFTQSKCVVSTAQSARALSQQLLTPLWQFILIVFQSLFRFVQLSLLFSMFLLESIKSRLQLKENTIFTQLLQDELSNIYLFFRLFKLSFLFFDANNKLLPHLVFFLLQFHTE